MSKKVFINSRGLSALVNENTEVGSYTIGAGNGDSYYHVGEENNFPTEENAPVDENINLEVDSSEVDLSSFKKKETLPPSIWGDDETLDSRIRLKLLDIADDFWEFCNVTWVEPKGIIITGSLCNYNWSRFSDIDLHLVVDYNEVDEKTEFVTEYFKSKKSEWNERHSNLKIMDFPVELYVQNINEDVDAGGVYDLEENKWIRKPDYDSIKSIGLNKYRIKDTAAEIMTIIDDMYDALNGTEDSYEIRTIQDDAGALWKKVKELRKDSLGKFGENGDFNIVYKCMRRMGYLDKLFSLMGAAYDKENSISPIVSESAGNGTDLFQYAKERFGTTYDIRECGYILPDGSMLDFTGKHLMDPKSDSSHLSGRRCIDHRDIKDLEYERDGWTETGIKVSMESFIRMGAIRVNATPTYSYINLFVKPTPEQNSVIERVVRFGKGCVDVEIGDGNESLSFAEYDNVFPRRVINDIIRYFDDGIKLMGNVRESILCNKNMVTYLRNLKNINEEVVADGDSEHNPYAKRWKEEREALKNFLTNYGKIMTSKENGKQYKVFYDKTFSDLIGYNYCICIQWDPIKRTVSATPYIRALDKFTDRIFQATYDTRGRDNMGGTVDDVSNYYHPTY